MSPFTRSIWENDSQLVAGPKWRVASFGPRYFSYTYFFILTYEYLLDLSMVTLRHPAMEFSGLMTASWAQTTWHVVRTRYTHMLYTNTCIVIRFIYNDTTAPCDRKNLGERQPAGCRLGEVWLFIYLFVDILNSIYKKLALVWHKK